MIVRNVVEGSKVTLLLQGKFDSSTRQQFNMAVREAVSLPEAKEIEVNLAQVNYIDSTACGMLLFLHGKASEVGKTVVLAGAGGTVKHVLNALNFKQMFSFR